MSHLQLTNRFLAFEDANPNNNPQQRHFDWSRQHQGLPVSCPANEPFTIHPFDSVELFDGCRHTEADLTTQYSVSNVCKGTYRLKYTGTGSDPMFRHSRTLALTTYPPTAVTITFTPQANQSVVVTTSAGNAFTNVLEGDVAFVPGISNNNPAGPFSTLNEGYWSVLRANPDTLTLSRFPGTVYQVWAESPVITDPSQFQVFSSCGVQVSDTLGLLHGFPKVMCQSFVISQVTADTIDFLSGDILPPITSIIPGDRSLVVFKNAKVFVYLETNQDVLISINGNEAFKIEPWLAGDSKKVGSFQLSGTVYSLKVTNISPQPASIVVISAE